MKSTTQKDFVINHFIQFIKREASTVVVAGSKDDPIFPIQNPDVFVGAHGGILHAERFPNTTLKCGIVSNWLLCRQAEYCNTIRTLIKDVNLDLLIVIESISSIHEDIHPSSLVRVDGTCVMRLSLLQCTLLELKYLGFQYLYHLISVLPPRKIIGFLLQVINEKTSYLTRLSTGMFSVLYFYDLLSGNSKLSISGIGLQLSGSYFFDKSNQMAKAGHFSQDLFIADRLTARRSPDDVSVEFTDPEALKSLSELHHAPFKLYIKQYLASIKT